MPFRRQKFIHRSDLRSNPDVVYLFGDNEQRLGLGGQAKEMRGEPNARGVRTKNAPFLDPAAFWDDADYESHRTMINNDLGGLWAFMQEGGTVVCPTDGLGTGYSQLPTLAPKTHAYLESCLKNFQDNFGPKGEAR